jgi:hypothetical protein
MSQFIYFSNFKLLEIDGEIQDKNPIQYNIMFSNNVEIIFLVNVFFKVRKRQN